MIREANNFCRRLWQDESGVVLALTVVVFLTLFVIACSVYAAGETVRQRVELQNAADVAAYSAAVVQADAISRVAAINKAMSWTYVQMARCVREYILDKWLWLALKELPDSYAVTSQLAQYTAAPGCNPGDWYAGTGPGNRTHVFVNGRSANLSALESALVTVRYGLMKSYLALAPIIAQCKTDIESMNQAELNIVNQLPNNITTTVRNILLANIHDDFNDTTAGGAALRYKLLQSPSPLSDYFDVDQDEVNFLRYSAWIERPDDCEELLGKGVNSWLPADTSQGVRRYYKQADPYLKVSWSYFGRLWLYMGHPPVCSPTARMVSGSPVIWAGDPRIQDGNYTTATAMARKLKPAFFGGNGVNSGTIVVGVARRMNNPFQFMWTGGWGGTNAVPGGIYQAFNVGDGQRLMWANAAARAGYRPFFFHDAYLPGGVRNPNAPKGPREAGEYETTFYAAQNNYELTVENKIMLPWNLSCTDWDALLLPLHRAWSAGVNDAYQNPATGAKILQTLSEAQGWQDLYGASSGAIVGLGTNAAQSVKWDQAEALILH